MRFSFLTSLWCLLAAVDVVSAQAKRPNVIFILADDLRFDALGCMGNKIIKTPNIDKLAAQGVLFRNAFVTTSICAVSRASILTGQWQRRHGIDDFDKGLNGAKWAKTFVALLRMAGYRTGFIGKFGVGTAKEIKAKAPEFDYWRGLPGQAGPVFIEKKDPARTHKTAVFGNEALEFIQGCKTDQPFCLCISFNAPHARDGQPREFEPDPRDEELYADVAIPVSRLGNDEAFKRLPDFVQKSEGRKRWLKRFATAEMYQRTVKDYYRLISGIDREVGRIRAELEARGLAKNTVIIFFSDNGFFLGDRGLSDKWFMYEESIRVPCIITDLRPVFQRDKQLTGRKEDAIVLNVDLAPTIIDLAGLPLEKAMQGRSLTPFLHQKMPPGDWRREFFYEHHTAPKIIPRCEGVRGQRWAYIRWIDAQLVAEELFDLSADPFEEHNLAADPARAETLLDMRARWEKWRQELK